MLGAFQTYITVWEIEKIWSLGQERKINLILGKNSVLCLIKHALKKELSQYRYMVLNKEKSARGKS